MKDHEILANLIEIATEKDAEVHVRMKDVLDLYARLLAKELLEAIDTSKAKRANKPSCDAEATGKVKTTPEFTGKGAPEKKATAEMLAAYRAKHGLGCYAKLASLSGIDETDIREMAMGGKYPLEQWQRLRAALDILEVENS
jgi:dsRNA-specific ribonuclease